jgi:two-component system chemotaxis response regulator CheY
MKSIIVDDDKTCASIFKAKLSKYGNCDVVHNGKDALKAYEESLDNDSPYRLMVLDIVLPNGMSGGEVFKLIRQLEAKKQIPEIDKLRIIFATGYDDWYNRNIIIKNIDYAYENYFIKSSNMEEFLDKVHELGFVLD